MSRLQPELHEGFYQALLCAGYRLPGTKMPVDSRASVIALRHGLVALAAIQHEFDQTPRENWWRVIQEVALWGRVVSDHLAPHIANQATEPVRLGLPLLRHGGDFEQVLRMVVSEFEANHSHDLFRRGPWWKRWTTVRSAKDENGRSVLFALAFLERRRFGCEEVQQIALLGE